MDAAWAQVIAVVAVAVAAGSFGFAIRSASRLTALETRLEGDESWVRRIEGSQTECTRERGGLAARVGTVETRLEGYSGNWVRVEDDLKDFRSEHRESMQTIISSLAIHGLLPPSKV